MRICLCPRAEPEPELESQPEPDIPIELNSSLHHCPSVPATMRQGQKSSNCESGSKDIPNNNISHLFCLPHGATFPCEFTLYCSNNNNNNCTKPNWVAKNNSEAGNFINSIVIGPATATARRATCTGIITAHCSSYGFDCGSDCGSGYGSDYGSSCCCCPKIANRGDNKST